MQKSEVIDELLEDMELTWTADQVLDFALACYRERLEASSNGNAQALHDEMKRERENGVSV